MRGGSIVATNITVEYGATVVLDRVSLTVPPGARIGVVGPNGSGKSTLLRVLAGADEPSAGRVERVGTVGYLPQEPERRDGETLLGYLARRTAVAGTEARMQRGDADAVDEFLTLGGADLEPRARKVCAQLGIAVPLDAELPTLSGGEAARLSLAALLLSRFDVLCLDEPTNDLDFDGLERLETFVQRFTGPIVLVSHDRAFLDRTVTRIVAFEAETRRTAEFAGTYAEFEAERLRALDRQHAAYADFVDERGRFEQLLGVRREQARHGLNLGRRETQALKSKVAQARRRLERLDEVEKPWRPWRLELELSPIARSGDLVARLSGAVVQRSNFRLGPIDLAVGWGDRIAIVGPNGAGKTTLLRALLGDVPLAAGTRTVGTGVVVGELDQRRELFASDEPLLERFRDESGLLPPDARTLLAKFGIRGEDALRPAASLSPGERSRAVLALLQGRAVNCLVLDEPTNHLDLEAIEQLEDALADYPGTVLLVTHDRRFLERFGAARTIAL
ncbi:MAG: ABC-F family ATP-binding cassette domain-containing protein [Gaiellaceae bacterium]